MCCRCVRTVFRLILIGISHLASCPRPAWAVFQDFDSPLHCCKYFSSSFSFHALFFLFRGSAGTILDHQHAFPSECKDSASAAPVFLCIFDTFRVHPDIAVANLSRPIRSRIAWNNSRGTATSAIWKTIFREWRTTFAPILINFSRNVVKVQ